MSKAPLSSPKCSPKCPQCGKPADQAYKPFCSKRCADVDLGRWLNEDYRLPATQSDVWSEDDDEAYPN